MSEQKGYEQVYMVGNHALTDKVALCWFSHMRLYNDIFDIFWELPQATIAQVHGFAVGEGLDLAVYCDLVIASTDAVFRLDPVFAVGGRYTNMWPLLMGMRKTKEIMLTDAWVKAEEAERFNMINKAVPPEKLEEEVEAMARKIARMPVEFICYNRLSINKFFESMGLRNAIETSLYWHVIATWMKKRQDLIKTIRQSGWRAGLLDLKETKILKPSQ